MTKSHTFLAKLIHWTFIPLYAYGIFKQVDDLTSDNIDWQEQYSKLKNINTVLKEQLNNCQSELVVAGIKDLKFRNKLLETQKEILWEYISDKDVNDIEKRFQKL